MKVFCLLVRVVEKTDLAFGIGASFLDFGERVSIILDVSVDYLQSMNCSGSSCIILYRLDSKNFDKVFGFFKFMFGFPFVEIGNNLLSLSSTVLAEERGTSKRDGC